MGFFDSATNAVNQIGSSVSGLINSGPASALSSISDGIKGAFDSVASMVKPLSGVKLPLPNLLFKYATYDYVITISVLKDEDLNFPDKTYRAGKRTQIICKSANADPSNRVNTPYGKFDFYVDNLSIASVVGHENGNNTNATGITFDVTEPYSMGLFTMACQQAAWEAKHKNWREAPFLLTIDFRGNTESGAMAKIQGTTRHIPFKWQNISMVVKETGSVYRCEAMPYNQSALTTKVAALKSDTSTSGSTVQEVLQTGEKSLQAVVNQRLQQLKKDGIVSVPDEVLILFPNDYSSSGANSGAAGNTETQSSATTSAASTPDAVYKKLGVTRSAKNQTLIQAQAECNELGKSSMGFDQTRKGTPPVGKDNQVYSPTLKVNVRGNNTSDQTVSDFKFSQNTDIPNAINQVLLQSKFAVDTLGADRLSPEGYRKWWKIDVQTYNVSTSANDSQTGIKPKIIVYRVIPYKVHSSTGAPPNVKPPGFEELKKQAVKQYNYIYTGKNVDILRFEIKIENSFATLMAADGLKRSQDVQQAADDGGAEGKKVADVSTGKGNAPEKGTMPTTASYTATGAKTDRKGGGGPETEGTRAARLFHDAINNGKDLVNISMDIIGDPYFLAQSGMGNYTAKGTQFENLNADGSINYQNGEVDILINFRTPVDINQTTGMYNFSAGSKSAPVLQFSGLYRVTNITSNFKNNMFTQTLECIRRNMQEATVTSKPSQTYNTSTPATTSSTAASSTGSSNTTAPDTTTAANGTGANAPGAATGADMDAAF